MNIDRVKSSYAHDESLFSFAKTLSALPWWQKQSTVFSGNPLTQKRVVKMRQQRLGCREAGLGWVSGQNYDGFTWSE